MVPISNFVTLKPAQQVNSIERVDGHRVYHVRANVEARRQRQRRDRQDPAAGSTTQPFPHDVRVAFKGGSEQQDESGTFLIEAAFLALFLIAMVLLAMFNSFYHAGLILVAVVLAMIGALLGMVVMGQPFSIIMTGTGMLALAGIVVNHNIVLIDTFHRLRDSGMDPIEAVIRSSAQRLRPVFLTTITAIGGLLPMMFAIEINFATREVTIGGPNGLDVGSALDRDRVRPGVLQDDHAGAGAGDAGAALSPARARPQLRRGRRQRASAHRHARSGAGAAAERRRSRRRSPRSNQLAATGVARATPGATSGSFSTSLSFSSASAACFCLFHIAA